jgi:hypothetical protein
MPLLVSRRVAFPLRSRWKYSRAGHYAAVSEFVKSVLQEGGVAEEKITVVPDGVPLLDPSSGDTVLALARKGVELAREAAQLAGVSIEVTADLERDLPRAALLVYATESEGLGSGALLAMSAGVPVIASNVGGLREVISDGENGWLVDNSPTAFAAALREATADPAATGRRGQAAARTIRERFTIDKMTERTIGIYHKVLS